MVTKKAISDYKKALGQPEGLGDNSGCTAARVHEGLGAHR